MTKIIRACEGCGEMKLLAYTAKFCNDCKWSRGEVWILHMTKNIDDEWRWEKIDFN